MWEETEEACRLLRENVRRKQRRKYSQELPPNERN
jgi:hypothetical protein